MHIFNLISFSVFQLISCIFFFVYLLGLFSIHFSDRNDYCIMTYMFEYPQFVRIVVPSKKPYPEYGLYAYSEGRLTERARKMWFDGIPVLFLPGNSGSHMQGRSLASVALRKAMSHQHDFHFDFFTVSYNEELSGLYGGVLQKQTEFAALAIKKILNLYKTNAYKPHPPTSVILIGHSMGGLIAKRLLSYRDTFNITNIAITLATPLEVPIMNIDTTLNDYYTRMNKEWNSDHINYKSLKQKKTLLSFGNGVRDVLVPSSLTGSADSDVSVLTTAIPGVWISPDHTEQIEEDKSFLVSKAKQYFEVNRSIFLNLESPKRNLSMNPDAFWYEDNRGIYQISRPQIDKLTYLMIRLVKYPHNRFVAIEAINLDDKDWLFGCDAKYTYANHRYCKTATSLSELTRWTGVATDFGRRKLGTIHLHELMKHNPDWTHVIVKVSPTRKPVTLNVDINDHTSRQVTVDLPSIFVLSPTVIIQETEHSALYYELSLPGMNLIHNAYLLYIEPTSSCKASQYHVSVELHVPWAKNHEYYHYFTHIKTSSMKLRLQKSNPNITSSSDTKEYIKLTVLLDPQCRFRISIASSWYHQLAQIARFYSPLLFPYAAAIILLAARSNIMNISKTGNCLSIHGALTSDGVKPYYVLVLTRLCAIMLASVSVLAYIFETSGWKNLELQYFSRSLLIVPMYMSALGLLNVVAAVIVIVMICSSQLAHRLLLRILWRGRSSMAEKIASSLQKIPTVVSAALSCAAPVSCGAASLAAGAAFYAFMLSKMYEDYLEDYFYKLMSKAVARIACFFKKRKSHKDKSLISESRSDFLSESDATETKKTAEKVVDKQEDADTLPVTANKSESEESKALISTKDVKSSNKDSLETPNKPNNDCGCPSNNNYSNALNFHMMMFFLWLIVTMVNMPALLTWARNFKYSVVLKPDTSYYTGIAMSVCAGFVWQIETPRKNLKHYELLSQALFVMAIFILVLAPFAWYYINYIVTGAFILITVQQLFDQEESTAEVNIADSQNENIEENTTEQGEKNKESQIKSNPQESEPSGSKTENSNIPKTEETVDPCDPCSEYRIYSIFRNIKEKLSLKENDNL